MTVGIGGFINSSHPMLAVRGLIRRGLQQSHRRRRGIVGSRNRPPHRLLAVAKKVVAPYVGAEGLAPIGPAFRAAAERGQIEVFELDEAMYYAALRAAAQRVPFNPWRSGVGTSFPRGESQRSRCSRTRATARPCWRSPRSTSTSHSCTPRSPTCTATCSTWATPTATARSTQPPTSRSCRSSRSCRTRRSAGIR